MSDQLIAVAIKCLAVAAVAAMVASVTTCEVTLRQDCPQEGVGGE